MRRVLIDRAVNNGADCRDLILTEDFRQLENLLTPDEFLTIAEAWTRHAIATPDVYGPIRTDQFEKIRMALVYARPGDEGEWAHAFITHGQAWRKQDADAYRHVFWMLDTFDDYRDLNEARRVALDALRECITKEQSHWLSLVMTRDWAGFIEQAWGVLQAVEDMSDAEKEERLIELLNARAQAGDDLLPCRIDGVLALNLAALGRFPEAREVARRIEQASPKGQFMLQQMSAIIAGIEQKTQREQQAERLHIR